MPKRVNYLMLDKDDITNVCGIISRHQAMRELNYDQTQFENFMRFQKLFKGKYFLVKDEFKRCEKRKVG